MGIFFSEVLLKRSGSFQAIISGFARTPELSWGPNSMRIKDTLLELLCSYDYLSGENVSLLSVCLSRNEVLWELTVMEAGRKE